MAAKPVNHNYWALVPGPCAPQWAREVGTAMRSPYTATEWPPLATAGDLAQQQRLSSAKNKYINPKQNNIKMPHNCSLKCQSFIHLYSKTLTFSGVMMFVALIILHRSWCRMIFPNTQLSLNRVFFSSLVMKRYPKQLFWPYIEDVLFQLAQFYLILVSSNSR